MQRKYCCKIKSAVLEDTKTSVAVLIQSQSKNVANAIINKIMEKYVDDVIMINYVPFLHSFLYFNYRTIDDGPYWCKSLEFVLDMLSLSNEELINLYNFAMSKHSDNPNCIHIIQVTLTFILFLNLNHSIDLLFNVS
jgi:hypothetical protein